MTNGKTFAIALIATVFAFGLVSVPAAQAADDAMMSKSSMHTQESTHLIYNFEGV
jgi:hypothetical protein